MSATNDMWDADVKRLGDKIQSLTAERDKYREDIAEIRQTNHGMNGLMCIDKLCEQALSETEVNK